jgi:short-subunit dehydrogenase
MRLPRFRFRGSTAVVTGAASGIGEQLAHQLASRGTDLVLIDRDAERLRAVAAGVRSDHPQREVGTIVLDLRDGTELATVAAGIRAAHPSVNLLVNNAGVALAGLFEQMTLEEFEWLVDINFRAPVRLTHHLLPALRAARGSHVVNMSSVFGLVAPPGQTAYASSKFALRGFSESLRSELSVHGIGVTTVHPGGVRTAIARTARAASGISEEDAAAGRAAIDRVLTIPAEIAAAKILDAVERRKPRLLIGASARIPDVLARVAPAGHALVFRPLLRRPSSVKDHASEEGTNLPGDDEHRRVLRRKWPLTRAGSNGARGTP